MQRMKRMKVSTFYVRRAWSSPRCCMSLLCVSWERESCATMHNSGIDGGMNIAEDDTRDEKSIFHARTLLPSPSQILAARNDRQKSTALGFSRDNAPCILRLLMFVFPVNNPGLCGSYHHAMLREKKKCRGEMQTRDVVFLSRLSCLSCRGRRTQLQLEQFV